MKKKLSNNESHQSRFLNSPKFKPIENIGLDGNRNPPEDVDTIQLTNPVTIYPSETKTK